MEAFIKEQRKKLVLYRIMYIACFIVAVGLFVLGKLGILHSADTSNTAPLTGAFMGAIIATIVQAVQVKKALKSEEKLKALYIAQTDERLLTISKSTAHLTINIMLVMLLISGSVFAYINEVIYYTLFSVMVCMVVVMMFCDLYFRKKY